MPSTLTTTEHASPRTRDDACQRLLAAAKRAVSQGSSPVAMARIARAELHDVPFTDLLEAFVAIVDSDVKWSSTREAAATLVRHSAHTVPSDRELLSVYATFCADYSSYAVAVTTDVFRGRFGWSLQTVNSSLPGLFNRRVYDAFRFQSARRERTRSQYLRYRLEIRKLGLSSDDRSLALLLSESWDGTMAELLATATSLTYDATRPTNAAHLARVLS